MEQNYNKLGAVCSIINIFFGTFPLQYLKI